MSSLIVSSIRFCTSAILSGAQSYGQLESKHGACVAPTDLVYVQQQLTLHRSKSLENCWYRIDILFERDNVVNGLFPILNGWFGGNDGNLSG